MPSNKPPYTPTPAERDRMLITPEMHAPSVAHREQLSALSPIPQRYLNADGSIARDVVVVYNRDGSLKDIKDYRS